MEKKSLMCQTFFYTILAQILKKISTLLMLHVNMINLGISNNWPKLESQIWHGNNWDILFIQWTGFKNAVVLVPNFIIIDKKFITCRTPEMCYSVKDIWVKVGFLYTMKPLINIQTFWKVRTVVFWQSIRFTRFIY